MEHWNLLSIIKFQHWITHKDMICHYKKATNMIYTVVQLLFFIFFYIMTTKLFYLGLECSIFSVIYSFKLIKFAPKIFNNTKLAISVEIPFFSKYLFVILTDKFTNKSLLNWLLCWQFRICCLYTLLRGNSFPWKRCCWLVGFYGIWTFVDYLMPTPFSYK